MTRQQWRSIHSQLPAGQYSSFTVLVFLADCVLFAASAILWTRTGGLLIHVAALIAPVFAMVQFFLLVHEATHGAVCRNKRWNDLVGHVCGWLIFLPFLPRQRNHLLHHAWAGHPTRDPENRRAIAKFSAMSDQEAQRLEFVWRHWIPLFALNSAVGTWLDPFRERSAGDRSQRIRKEIRFVWIYLGGYMAAFTCAQAAHAALQLVGWYMLAWIAELAMVELVSLPHHAETPLLSPDAGRLEFREQETHSHSCASVPFWSRWVILNFNLHVVHHAFPWLPWFRLTEAQRLMSEQGLAAGQGETDEVSWSLQKRGRPLLELMGHYFDTQRKFSTSISSSTEESARGKRIVRPSRVTVSGKSTVPRPPATVVDLRVARSKY